MSSELIYDRPQLIKSLEQLRDYHKKDQYRTRAYDAAIENIKAGRELPAKSHILAKVNEFAKTGKIQECEDIAARAKSVELFSKIMGVGQSHIDEWLAAGYRTLGDLRKHAKLTQTQRLGLLYYDDLNTPIPRDTITRVAKSFGLSDKSVICGSYRRGSETSGDIDICTCDDAKTTKERLKSDPRYVATVLDGDQRFTFLMNLSPHVKTTRVVQVDFLFATPETMPLATLYLTGSAAHQTALRRRAKSLGGKLSQNSFVLNGKKQVVKSERDVYRLLGLEYLEPKDRI